MHTEVDRLAAPSASALRSLATIRSTLDCFHAHRSPPFGPGVSTSSTLHLDQIEGGRTPCKGALYERRSGRTTGGVAGRPSAGIRGSRRVWAATSGAGYARDEMKPAVDMSNTYADLQGFYGSDGTRTRDLRRDRPAF